MNGNDGSPGSRPSTPAPLRVRSTQIDRRKFPDINKINSVMLSDGPRARKEATFILVTDRHTGELHHDGVTIKTYRKHKGKWSKDRLHSITLSSEVGDELQTLIDFVRTCRSESIPNETGTFVVVEAHGDEQNVAQLQKALNQLPATGKVDVLANVLGHASANPKLVEMLLQRAEKDPLLFAEAAAALNLATYRRAVDDLKKLIETSDREQDFQKLLGQNPWMFGSEYSELLERRKFTRDENQDFVVRRTADGYIEAIEIKTPLGGMQLFNYDKSHDSYYAGAELSKGVGQVEKYIEELDRCRDAILAKDGEDTCKIRAKIIIGREGDADQLQALRRFNGHLHRIEVMTFDQLLKIAENVLGYISKALRPVVEADAS